MPEIKIPGHKYPSRSFRGTRNSVFYKVSRSQTALLPLLKGSSLFLMHKQFFKHFSRGSKGIWDLLTLLNTEFFVPLKDLEGYLCPEILISGMIYIVDTPFGISSWRLKTFQNSMNNIHALFIQLHACTLHCGNWHARFVSIQICNWPHVA